MELRVPSVHEGLGIGKFVVKSGTAERGVNRRHRDEIRKVSWAVQGFEYQAAGH